jgi:N-formylglutamate amidohydrolase
MFSKHLVAVTWGRCSFHVLLFSVVVLAGLLESFAQEASSLYKFLTLWAGTLPIIFSAPHGGRQPVAGANVRRGVGVAQFATGRDHNTDELAEKIAAKLEVKLGAKPFLLVANFERKYLDVNRPPESAYESAVAKFYYDAYHSALREAHDRVRREWGRGLLLDIHGQSARDDTIYRGTNNGKTVMSLIRRFGAQAMIGPQSIFSWLEQEGYKVLPPTAAPHQEDRYAGGYIVQTYGSYHQQGGIDAIQLEFGAKLRARANLERTATDLADAIAVFAQAYLPLVRSHTAIDGDEPTVKFPRHPGSPSRLLTSSPSGEE